jgi:hypothetical protein
MLALRSGCFRLAAAMWTAESDAASDGSCRSISAFLEQTHDDGNDDDANKQHSDHENSDANHANSHLSVPSFLITFR